MKKTIILVSIFLTAVVTLHAQDYKKFRVGLGIGYAMAGGSGAKGGVLATIEPGYRVQDNILLGLRLESAVITRGLSEDFGDAISIDVAGIGSYTVNGQYYFNNNNFRPFFGLGLGLYSLAAIKVDVNFEGETESGEVDGESKFGFYPRVGFDAGHFTMALDYNLIPTTKLEGSDVEFKNSYLGIRAGFFIGGGKN
jgi:outer membrane protein W